MTFIQNEPTPYGLAYETPEGRFQPDAWVDPTTKPSREEVEAIIGAFQTTPEGADAPWIILYLFQPETDDNWKMARWDKTTGLEYNG